MRPNPAMHPGFWCMLFPPAEPPSSPTKSHPSSGVQDFQMHPVFSVRSFPVSISPLWPCGRQEHEGLFTTICPVFSPEPGRKTAETRERGEREAEEKKEEVREGGRREEEEVLNYLSFFFATYQESQSSPPETWDFSKHSALCVPSLCSNFSKSHKLSKSHTWSSVEAHSAAKPSNGNLVVSNIPRVYNNQNVFVLMTGIGIKNQRSRRKRNVPGYYCNNPITLPIKLNFTGYSS